MSVQPHYVAEGPADAPVLVLSGSLGSTLRMWDPQVAALSEEYRVVRYDTRGHGSSPVPPGPYSVADLGYDVLALLDLLGVQRAHFAGISLGGMTGMWLAANAPERVDRLALLCTSARLGPPQMWTQRAATARTEGTAALADAVVRRWFTADFAEHEPGTVQRMADMVAATPGEGYAGCCAAIENLDLRADLARITAPTLVVAGAEDHATPPSHAAFIAAGIGGAGLRVVPDAAHLAAWERSTSVNRLLRDHFAA